MRNASPGKVRKIEKIIVKRENQQSLYPTLTVPVVSHDTELLLAGSVDNLKTACLLVNLKMSEQSKM